MTMEAIHSPSRGGGGLFRCMCSDGCLRRCLTGDGYVTVRDNSRVHLVQAFRPLVIDILIIKQHSAKLYAGSELGSAKCHTSECFTLTLCTTFAEIVGRVQALMNVNLPVTARREWKYI